MDAVELLLNQIAETLPQSRAALRKLKTSIAAQAKADDMATKGYFAHTSPDGKNSWYWFKQAGYTFTYAGENLALDFS